MIPLGMISGVLAGWRENQPSDRRFRIIAFISTSVPPFILGLFLLSIFYVGLGWFPPGRTGIRELSLQTFSTFERHTGFLTIDGLLNGRLDVTLDAYRHLVLPIFTLSLAHWATLGRITRATMIEVKDMEYITAARARGLLSRSIVWRHAFKNATLPALTSSRRTHRRPSRGRDPRAPAGPPARTLVPRRAGRRPNAASRVPRRYRLTRAPL
jgi:peptide/nickel transport system permease protein